MTERLPLLSARQVIGALARLGFSQMSQRGSHVKLRNAEGVTVIVPLHSELARGTLRSILRQAEVEVRDLLDHL